MKSRISLVVGALALAATTLAAQAPAAGTFKLTGLAVLADPAATPQPTVSFGGGSYYSSPYSGAFATTLGGTTFDSPFLVWCVDPGHESYFNDVYNVEVSNLTGDLSDTRLGTGGANAYDWAAYLASSMNLNWSSSTNRATSVDYQIAIWDAITGGAFGASYSSLTSTALGALGLSSTFYTASFTTANPTFSLGGWQVITDSRVSDGSTGYSEQEFLAYNPPGTPEGNVTPEPATLSLMGTGLAGVLGMGLKRRRQNKIA